MRQIIRSVLKTAASLIVVCLIHYLLIEIGLVQVNFSTFFYYALLIIATSCVVGLSLLWHLKKPDQLNAGFLYGSVLKVVIVASCVFFLFHVEEKSDKMQIALLYIISLFIEIFFIGKRLNQESEKK